MEGELSELLLSCPACDETSINKLGPLREMYGAIDLSTPGHLYQCNSCTLLFRYPYISESGLEKAYSKFSSKTWAHTRERTDFNLCAGVILDLYSNGSVLDIGCFQGDFLQLLPDTFRKYGIEPSDPACKIARQRGIELVGTSINHVEVNHPMFRAITLLDVFEHLPLPMDALKKIVRLLLPGGIIIIATGNTDAFLWRLMRRDYWYYFPEHVSFTNPRWFDWAAAQLNLDVTIANKFTHGKGPFFQKWRQILNCLVYRELESIRPYSRLYKMVGLIYPFNKVKKWTSAPLANLLPDHMLVVLKSKPGRPV